MTLEEFMTDLDHWVDLNWEDLERDYAGLLLIGTLADTITPTDTPEEGPRYIFIVDGHCYSWAYGDGWGIDAEHLLNLVAAKLFDGMAEARDAVPTALPTDSTVPQAGPA